MGIIAFLLGVIFALISKFCGLLGTLAVIILGALFGFTDKK